MITDSFKQELLARVDIVDVIDARVPLKKAGANYTARCPFHSEKTPSFTVSQSKQFYHCFGCGAHGNAISFLMEYSGLGYVDAIRDLAQSVGMKLPPLEPRGNRERAEVATTDLYELMARAMEFYRQQLKGSASAIDYLKGRGLTGKIAARFGIGYAPADYQSLRALFPNYEDKSLVECGLVIEGENGRRYDRFRDRIIFPILNQRGQIVGFGGRVLGAGEPKYMNSPETPLFEKRRELYGLPQAREAVRAVDRVIVVEGYMDVVTLAQFGVENVVATLGTATTQTHLVKLLRQANEVVFCFDGDAAGRKAAWSALDVALGCLPDGKTIRFLMLEGQHDPDSFVRAEGADAFRALAERADPLSAFLVGELVRRHPIETAEGRAALVNEARPLLQKMTAVALRIQLVQAVARHAQMNAEEFGRLVGGPAPAGPGVRGTRPGDGSRPWRSAEAHAPGGVDRSGRVHQSAHHRRPEWEVLKSVLANPELEAAIPSDRAFGEHAAARALQQVLEFLRSGPERASTAALIEHFRGRPEEALIAEVYATVLETGLSSSQAEAELQGALRLLEVNQLEQQIEALKARQSGLTPEEEKAFVSLVYQHAALKRARIESESTI